MIGWVILKISSKAMIRNLTSALLIVAASTTLYAQSVHTVTVGRYRLQSNVWVNLHQWLLSEVQFDTPPPAALSGDDLAKWKKIADAYRLWVGKRNPIVDRELVAMNAALSATTSAKLPDSIPPAAATALEAAMPLYRAVQWDEDDRANRFWISLAQPMLASAGEELAEANAKAYGVPFPKHIVVDVTAYAWQFGAYTVGEGESAHTVIAYTDPANHGLSALEALVHEPSHAIVGGGRSDAIGADISRAVRELGVRPYGSLWHAILFYTAGETTRRALVRRGINDYKPIITLMYAGPFRGFKQPLELHWQAYLDGKVSREEAIQKLVMECAPPPKTSQ
jgi:hypothetical protein